MIKNKTIVITPPKIAFIYGFLVTKSYSLLLLSNTKLNINPAIPHIIPSKISLKSSIILNSPKFN